MEKRNILRNLSVISQKIDLQRWKDILLDKTDNKIIDFKNYTTKQISKANERYFILLINIFIHNIVN